MKDLLSGTFVAENKKPLISEDRINMDWEDKNDAEVCTKLIKAFSRRLGQASGRPITLSHTIPRLSLNGWPDSQAQYFMEAYSGSNLLGDVLESSCGDYHFCGHTHAKAHALIGKTRAINLGSDYNILRYAILKSEGEKLSVEEREVVIA